MKLNNKGFLLAETIVTVCIIATLATSMYLYVSKTASRFEERDNYENVVDVYKANTLKKYLKGEEYFSNTNATGEDLFTKISDTNLTTIKTELNVKYAYLITNNINGINSINTKEKKALEDYFERNRFLTFY